MENGKRRLLGGEVGPERLPYMILITRVVQKIIGHLKSDAKIQAELTSRFDLTFGATGELGAEFAGGAESQIEAARKFGLYLGVAFQVTDDLLDYAGDENHVGKTLGTDLATQKPTLPVLHALETVSNEERAAWKNRLSNPDERLARDVMEFVKGTGALEYTQSFALRYCDLARHQLSFFPMSDARESLEHSLEFVVTRKH